MDHLPGKVVSCPAPPTTEVIETTIQCSPEAFYKFFKEQANLLPNVYRGVVQKIELADGNRSWVNTVGSRKVIQILPGDASGEYTGERFTYVVEAVDDHSRKITYKLLEGSLLQFYDPLTVTLQVTTASTAKWTIEYVKKDPSSNELGFYICHVRAINARVDRHLRTQE